MHQPPGTGNVHALAREHDEKYILKRDRLEIETYNRGPYLLRNTSLHDAMIGFNYFSIANGSVGLPPNAAWGEFSKTPTKG